MNKKRITTILLVGVIGIALVGGTYAWFTSRIKNVSEISSGATDENSDKDKAGIQVWIDSDEDIVFIPGTKSTHCLQVENTANYDQLVRVKVVAKWDNNDLDNSNLRLNLMSEENENVWIESGGCYYYNGKIAAKNFTEELALEVKLSEESGNIYKNEKFNITFEVEAVQADYNAYESEWNIGEDDDIKLIIDKAVNGNSAGIQKLNSNRNYVKEE